MQNLERIAIDVGGTFTDVVRHDPTSGGLRFEKVPTTPTEPQVGVLDGFAKVESDLSRVSHFNHGTTLGLNALLTRTGARVALVSTRGFRDVYLLGRTNRPVMYDIDYRKPEALMRRRDTFEVTERMYADGRVHTAFNVEDATRVARGIRDGGYDAVAVAFIHAYAYPDHELQMRDVLERECPEVEVTLSHELSREYREYERTSTAVLDAYIKPVMRGYLAELDDTMARRGFTGEFFMSRSGGGAMTAATAREKPVNLILSGPAGGVMGAVHFAKTTGHRNLITIDLGGTSLDTSLIVDGRPVSSSGSEFEGMPINTPSLYIHTIGAGGGSVAYLDDAGALQVGPRSAGAVPGPAAYGRGGTEPTFTDAALAVGYLDADEPLGGDLELRPDLADAALGTVAAPLDLTPVELAHGILQISITKIMGAVRAITVELGHDPADFALMSFGGGGGLVAVEVARELGVPSVIVPPGQGAFSALGMLMADVQHDVTRTSIRPLEDASLHGIGAVFEDLEAEASAALASDGFAPDQCFTTRTIELRYVGQEHSVALPWPDVVDDVATITRLFAEQHVRQYGHASDDPVEVTTMKVTGVGRIPQPELPSLGRRPVGEPVPMTERLVAVDATTRAPYSIVRREDLLAGDRVEGPAVISEHTATTVIGRGDVAEVDDHGALIVQVAPQ